MGIKGEVVDGMDFFAVYSKVNEIINKVRDEQRPYILQVNTYRYRGHSMSDPATYRTKDEVKYWKDRDAVKHFALRLQELNVLKENEVEAINDENDEKVNDIFERAKACELTDISELTTDIIC